jgi:choline-sulfatase
VSHVDAYPFILRSVGETDPALTEGFPGVSLEDIADGAKPDRNVLTEYHGMGSATGAFMIRHKQYKYVYYVDYPPQLFDLASDPEELEDRAADPHHASVLRECHERLLKICDPHDVDRMVRERQSELLAANGGREAVIARGDLGFSPPPGAPVIFD